MTGFSEALEGMKAGHRALRSEWIINRRHATHLRIIGDAIVLIAAKPEGHAATKWQPDNKDLMAEDWEVSQ